MGIYNSGIYNSGIYNSGIYRPDSDDTVTIGGRKYKTVKIGDQVWLAENLDFVFDGLVVGEGESTEEPRASYYNNDEETYGWNGYKCGLLYNWYAVKYLKDHKSELLPSGWNTPTIYEWTALTDAVGDDAGMKLKAVDNSVASGTWPTGWNGTDDYGFGVLPTGFFGAGRFQKIDYNGYFWSASEASSSNAHFIRFYTNPSVDIVNYVKTFCFPVRLVKDSPVSLLGGSLLGSPNVEATDGE